MTDNQIATMQPFEADAQARLKDLEDENELLLLQLHQVQEELERYFLKCQDLEKGGASACTRTLPAGGWVDDELPTVQAEVSRLTALVETQSRLREIESKNALNARLGDILIQSVSPSGSLVGLPGKLIGIWRASKAEQPSAALGGKTFDKVIEAFQKGGLESVNQLLAAELAPEIRAKAYTALARHQMKNGLFAAAVLSARRAYEEEPKPFRLKWLAFRLHDAGEIAEADACLSLLPQDTPFSDSETRQRDQVRYEAKSARLLEAKQKTGFESRRQTMGSQMQTLRRDCDQHARLAAERAAEITFLRQGQVRFEQEKSALTGRLEEAERRMLELGQAKEDSAKLAANRREENELLLTQLQQTQEELGRHFLKVHELEKNHARLEQEKSALIAGNEESAKLVVERQAEIKSLRHALDKFELEWSTLNKTIEDLARVRDEQSKLAQDRARQIEDLQRKAQERQAEESELATRQDMIREEMTRAEAQLDLLKDIFLREPGL